MPEIALLAPIGLTQLELVKLAGEVAKNIGDLASTLKLYNITAEQYEVLLATPFYSRALEISKRDWGSAESVLRRLQIEAAASLEAGLPVLTARMLNAEEPLPAVTEVAKFLAKVAGAGGEGRIEGTPGEKFAITINLGTDTTLRFEKDITPATVGRTSDTSEVVSPADQGAGIRKEVAEFTKGESGPSAPARE